MIVRSKHVVRCLENLNEDSGTGPHELSAKGSESLCRATRVPVVQACPRIVLLGCWPGAWGIHWLPLHKRKAKSDAGNYRAINLTAQISKVVERYLSRFFVPALEQLAVGATQFAYRKEHGARDAVLYYVLSWVDDLNN